MVKTRATLRRIGTLAASVCLAITAAAGADAQRAGTAAGTGHAGGGGTGGGAAHLRGGAPGHSGGAVPGHPGDGFRPGYRGYRGYDGTHGYRGYRGYYGWGAYGWGPRWGWGPGWGWGWNWGWGWPLGVYVSALPLYYSTFWWNGIPYYYADGKYYLWDDDLAQYEQIRPSAELMQQAATGASGSPTQLFAYPKSGQSAAQQDADKADCRRWATEQTGFDPNQAEAAAAKRPDYMRAQAACLEGRGYSVE